MHSVPTLLITVKLIKADIIISILLLKYTCILQWLKNIKWEVFLKKLCFLGAKIVPDSNTTPKPDALGLSNYSLFSPQNHGLLKRITSWVRNLENLQLLPQKCLAFREVCTCVPNWAAETSNPGKIIQPIGYKCRYCLRSCLRVWTPQFLHSFSRVNFLQVSDAQISQNIRAIMWQMLGKL